MFWQSLFPLVCLFRHCRWYQRDVTACLQQSACVEADVLTDSVGIDLYALLFWWKCHHGNRMETETNSFIPILNVLVKKGKMGQISTSVFRKATHSGRYLSYRSKHSLKASWRAFHFKKMLNCIGCLSIGAENPYSQSHENANGKTILRAF